MNKVTFGIITDGTCWDRVERIIGSIIMEVPWHNRQIIIVGGDECPEFIARNCRWYPFDETVHKGWITKKKNIIAKAAKHDNVVLAHDYVSFCEGWYQGFIKFNEENLGWFTFTNRILNQDGNRFRDLAEIYNDAWMDPPIDDNKPPTDIAGKLIPYNEQPDPRWQYYSGAYFAAKRSVLLEVPLDESRVWGQGEDVKFNREVYKKFGKNAFSFNQYSIVKFLKQKDRAPWEK